MSNPSNKRELSTNPKAVAARNRRAAETPEQREQRLAADRERARRRYQENAEARESKKRQRLEATPEQTQVRLFSF